jgi:hypothetical protein
MAFDKFVAPNLPIPPRNYDHGYFNQLVRTIGSFFKVIDSRAGVTVESLTSNFISIPSGEYDLSASPHDNLVLPKTSFVRFIGATSTFNITGFDAKYGSDGTAEKLPRDGQLLIIYNASGHALSLRHDNAGSLPGNRIITGGSNVSVSHLAGAILIYSVNDIPPTPTGYWILLANK